MEKAATTKEIAQLIENIVSPQKGERMLFLTDYLNNNLLLQWHEAAKKLSVAKGFRLLPVVCYEQTGKHNADLPKKAFTYDRGSVDNLAELISSANIVIAMTHNVWQTSAPLTFARENAPHIVTKYSASAPLKSIAKKTGSLRIVSMPGVTPDMWPAICADYKKISERGKKLLAVVQSTVGFELIFDGKNIPRGTKLYIDTRETKWLLDDGICHKPGDFINLPAGELFAAPHEGFDSQTNGILPVYSSADDSIAFLKIEKNKIVRVEGDCEEADNIINDIAREENTANIAELGFGINEKARSGERVPLLEKEKSGPHIAYGRSDHIGGKVKASTHKDYVYTRDTPITVTIFAVYQSGNRVLIAERGKVVAV